MSDVEAPARQLRRISIWLTGASGAATAAKICIGILTVPNLPFLLTLNAVLVGALVGMATLLRTPRAGAAPAVAVVAVGCLVAELRVLPPLAHAGSSLPGLLYLLPLVQAWLVMSACVLGSTGGVRHLVPPVICVYVVAAFLSIELPQAALLVSALLFTATLYVILWLVRALLYARADAETLYTKQRELNTRLSAAAAQIIEQKRRESLAVMAAGLAHEINNPVNYMKGNLRYLREHVRRLTATPEAHARTPRGEELAAAAEDVDAILDRHEQGLCRIAEIVSNLRAISGRRGGARTTQDLKTVLVSALRMLGLDRGGPPAVEVGLAGSLFLACDRADLFTLLSNLVRNAAEACGGEGWIRVRGERKDGWVLLSVEDGGCGIPSEKLPHIFDPFFSTKHDREHMGVGLCLCRSIVEEYGGSIDVTSQQGGPTCVTVRFPAAPAQV